MRSCERPGCEFHLVVRSRRQGRSPTGRGAQKPTSRRERSDRGRTTGLRKCEPPSPSGARGRNEQGGDDGVVERATIVSSGRDMRLASVDRRRRCARARSRHTRGSRRHDDLSRVRHDGASASPRSRSVQWCDREVVRASRSNVASSKGSDSAIARTAGAVAGGRYASVATDGSTATAARSRVVDEPGRNRSSTMVDAVPRRRDVCATEHRERGGHRYAVPILSQTASCRGAYRCDRHHRRDLPLAPRTGVR